MIDDQKTLAWAQNAVKEASASYYSPSTEGGLVHVVGIASTSQTLSDPLLHVNVHALELRRHVLIYQWVEQEETHHHYTSYSYDQEWTDGYVDSSTFHEPAGHRNRHGKFQAALFEASTFRIGPYSLCQALVGKIDDFASLSLKSVGSGYALPAPVRAAGGRLDRQDGTLSLYVGADSANPRIGDEQIVEQVIFPEAVSVIAEQRRHSLVPGRSSTGEDVALLYVGSHPASVVLARKASENGVRAWSFRCMGFIMMFVGFLFLSSPIMSLVGGIPIVGDLAAMGGCMLSLVMALLLTVMTSALAWFYYRPATSIVIIVVCLFVFVIGSRIAKAHTGRV